MTKGTFCRGGWLIGEFAAHAVAIGTASLVDFVLAVVSGVVWLISAYRLAATIGVGADQEGVPGDPFGEEGV